MSVSASVLFSMQEDQPLARVPWAWGPLFYSWLAGHEKAGQKRLTGESKQSVCRLYQKEGGIILGDEPLGLNSLDLVREVERDSWELVQLEAMQGRSGCGNKPMPGPQGNLSPQAPHTSVCQNCLSVPLPPVRPCLPGFFNSLWFESATYTPGTHPCLQPETPKFWAQIWESLSQSVVICCLLFCPPRRFSAQCLEGRDRPWPPACSQSPAGRLAQKALNTFCPVCVMNVEQSQTFTVSLHLNLTPGRS